MKQMRMIILAMVFSLLLAIVLLPSSAQAQERTRHFNETGFSVKGRILEYWEENGGLYVFGYPKGLQVEKTVNGEVIQYQEFERNRLELHLKNDPPFDVLLGRLGAEILEKKGRHNPANYNPDEFTIDEKFLKYYQSYGVRDTYGRNSILLFGLPISNAEYEIAADGKSYLTQWFERARFEYHPEHKGTPHEVQLGLLGIEYQALK